MAEASRFEYTVAPSMDIHWQNTKGPEWVADAPTWMQDNVRNFHRRGLPLVHLWQSDHMLLALGLNKHGVPGLYLTQNE